MTEASGRDSIAVAVAGTGHGPALAEFFARVDVPCHCRFWHFEGTNHDWLARCFHAPAENRAEMERAIATRSPEMRGIVATEGPRVVGWMKLAPASAVPKLYAQRPYRALSVFGGARDGVLALGCMLVDPEYRRRGIARRLIARGIDAARESGATAIEAFPRRGEGLRDEELLAGPYDALLAHGFEIVHDSGPYPVLCLTLSSAASILPDR